MSPLSFPEISSKQQLVANSPFVTPFICVRLLTCTFQRLYSTDNFLWEGVAQEIENVPIKDRKEMGKRLHALALRVGAGKSVAHRTLFCKAAAMILCENDPRLEKVEIEELEWMERAGEVHLRGA